MLTIFRHELRTGRVQFIVWTAVLTFMLSVCVLIYPQMSSQMNEVSDTFAQMGSFSEAFGMDKINFGEFLGYFSIECGSVIGLGGAFFSALLGISALAKEERSHTAEFLLTRPVIRKNIVTQKLLAVFVQIVAFNLVIITAVSLSTFAIGERPDAGKFILLFLVYFVMQLETATVTFGISAFLSRGAMGIGIGIAAVFYFLNIISNLSDKAKLLKFFTPFGYTDGSQIVSNGSPEIKYMAAGIAVLAAAIIIAYAKYTKKDIA